MYTSLAVLVLNLVSPGFDLGPLNSAKDSLLKSYSLTGNSCLGTSFTVAKKRHSQWDVSVKKDRILITYRKVF